MFLMAFFGVVGFFSFYFARICEMPREYSKLVFWSTVSAVSTMAFSAMGSYNLNLFFQ